MTAAEMSRAIHAASLHLAKNRGNRDWKSSLISEMQMNLRSALVTAEERYDSWDKAKSHVAQLLSFVAMQAMEIIGNFVPSDTGLDVIHAAKYHADSKWSKEELARDIQAIKKLVGGLDRTGKDEGKVMAEVVGRCRSICEGIGEDLFAYIERDLAKRAEAK